MAVPGIGGGLTRGHRSGELAGAPTAREGGGRVLPGRRAKGSGGFGWADLSKAPPTGKNPHSSLGFPSALAWIGSPCAGDGQKCSPGDPEGRKSPCTGPLTDPVVLYILSGSVAHLPSAVRKGCDGRFLKIAHKPSERAFWKGSEACGFRVLREKL
jgi:hypothetical protein